MAVMMYTRADGKVELTPIRINGIAVPCPSDWQIGLSDLHKNSERNASGYLTADRVRTNVRKFEIKWSYLLPRDYAALVTLISADMFMSLEYIGEDGDLKTMTVYKGDISSTPHRLLQTGELLGYMNVSVSMIER